MNLIPALAISGGPDLRPAQVEVVRAGSRVRLVLTLEDGGGVSLQLERWDVRALAEELREAASW